MIPDFSTAPCARFPTQWQQAAVADQIDLCRESCPVMERCAAYGETIQATDEVYGGVKLGTPTRLRRMYGSGVVVIDSDRLAERARRRRKADTEERAHLIPRAVAKASRRGAA